MGFDMRWEEEPPESVQAAEDAHAVFMARVRVRDALPRQSEQHAEAQRLVEAASRAMYDAEESYFRLNMSGMRVMRDAMDGLGMLHEHGQPTSDEWSACPRYPDDEGSPEYAAAEAATRNLTDRSVECPGIPAWKFGSNDGWLVNPIEIASALELYKRWCDAHDCDPAEYVPGGWAGSDDGVRIWRDWLRYLAGAQQHRGFRVH